MPLETGVRVDRYELLQPLGEGGQGAVWKARDLLSPESERAIKLLTLKHARTEDVERARREARVLARLNHPSLCRCHGLFEDLEHEVLGIVMDYVDGFSVHELLGDTRFSTEHRACLVRHLIAALAHIHEHGLVHRDVKLDNILVTRAFWERPGTSSNVKLVDFGIASLGDACGRLTTPGYVIGTPPFMAPEQIEPKQWRSEIPTPATDVFAVGIVSWLLLCGDHPTGLAENASLADFAVAYRNASSGKWPPRWTGPRALSDMRKCLALYPADRPANAGILAARFDQPSDAPSGDVTAISTSPHVASTQKATMVDETSIADGTVEQYPLLADIGRSPADRAPSRRRQARLLLVVLAAICGFATMWSLVISLDDRRLVIEGSALAKAVSTSPPETTTLVAQDAPTPAHDTSADTTITSSSLVVLPQGVYQARLSSADHLNREGGPIDHAFQVLQSDRLAQGRRSDPEDRPSAKLSWEQLKRFAELLGGADWDKTVAGKRVWRGEPLVEVTIDQDSVTVRILKGDCRDYVANLRWFLAHGETEMREWAAGALRRPVVLDDAMCAAWLEELENHVWYSRVPGPPRLPEAQKDP